MNDFEFEGNFDKVGYKKMLLNARRIYREDTDTKMISTSNGRSQGLNVR